MITFDKLDRFLEQKVTEHIQHQEAKGKPWRTEHNSEAADRRILREVITELTLRDLLNGFNDLNALRAQIEEAAP